MLPYLGNNVLKDLISSGAKPIASGASTLLEMAGTRCASCPRHYRYVQNIQFDIQLDKKNLFITKTSHVSVLRLYQVFTYENIL